MRILTKQKARMIKKLLWEGFLQRDIALEFTVTQTTISRILNGLQYPEVPWPNGIVGAMPRFRALEIHRGRLAARGLAMQKAVMLQYLDPQEADAIANEIERQEDAALDEVLHEDVVAVEPQAPQRRIGLEDPNLAEQKMARWSLCREALGPEHPLIKEAEAPAGATLQQAIRVVYGGLPRNTITPEIVERIARGLCQEVKT